MLLLDFLRERGEEMKVQLETQWAFRDFVPGLPF
jgi:hypothetical protein